jgi:hypothetical protein
MCGAWRATVDARLIQAVVHIITAVQCSIPAVQTREEALRVVCRSAVHAMSDFIGHGSELCGLLGGSLDRRGE